MEKIYLVYEIWLDPLENDFSDAVGYKLIGYVRSEEVANEIVSNGIDFTRKDCWAIRNTMPQFKFEELKLLK